MSPPGISPIGLRLTRTAKHTRRAFDDALAVAGGSLSSWLIVLALKTNDVANQRELAEAVGIRGATLTHHLDAMEADGVVVRRREPSDRRTQQVALTEEGQAAFRRMRAAAVAFDKRLQHGISTDDMATFTRVLHQLDANISGT